MRHAFVALVAALIVIGVAVADSVWLPVIHSPLAPVTQTILRVPDGYRVVGVTPFVACSNGRLAVSVFTVRPDRTEGHTVFLVQGHRLTEDPRFRGIPSRGGLFASDPLSECGLAGFVSIGMLDADALLLVAETN